MELQLEQGGEQGREREQEREEEVEGGLRHVAVVVVEEEAGVAFANLYMPVEKPAHTVLESTRGPGEEGEVRHRLTWLGYRCRANLCMAN